MLAHGFRMAIIFRASVREGSCHQTFDHKASLAVLVRSFFLELYDSRYALSCMGFQKVWGHPRTVSFDKIQECCMR